jgi:phage terminase small subunit
MTKLELVEALRGLNPHLPDDRIYQYAAALYDYRTAQANVDEHGAVVFHPRTGAPIENPYLGVRDRATKTIAALTKDRKINSAGLWI